MTPQSLETVRSIALSTLDVPHRQLNETTTLRDVGVDSLATLDLVFAIESHFGIRIGPGDLANVRSLKDLAACVDRLIAQEEYCFGAESHGA
jgi:acyl carrier protein